MFDCEKIQLIVTVPAGHARHYGALAALLSEKSDDMDLYGADMVDSVGFWLDVLSTNLNDEDTESLTLTLDRVLRNLRNGEGEAKPS